RCRLRRAGYAVGTWVSPSGRRTADGSGTLHLLVEFSRLFRGIPPYVEHHEIVDIGSPEKSGSGEVLCFLHLDPVIAENRSTYFSGSLTTIDEKNSLLSEKPVAAMSWTIHRISRNERALFRKGNSDKVCAESGREST